MSFHGLLEAAAWVQNTMSPLLSKRSELDVAHGLGGSFHGASRMLNNEELWTRKGT